MIHPTCPRLPSRRPEPTGSTTSDEEPEQEGGWIQREQHDHVLLPRRWRLHRGPLAAGEPGVETRVYRPGVGLETEARRLGEQLLALLELSQASRWASESNRSIVIQWSCTRGTGGSSR
jgi:hypothetical protein